MRAPATTLTRLQIVGTSSTIGVQPLLVTRSLSTSVVLAHTILFSCSHHFKYSDFDVWANGALLLAFLFVTFCTLLELVSEHNYEPGIIAAQLSNPDEETTTITTITTPIEEEPKSPPLLHRILPLLSAPLLQVGGSAVLFAAAAHYGTGGALFRGRGIATRYVDIILHVANPAIFMLDLVLGWRLRQRFRVRNIAIVWLFIGSYYGYAGIANRTLLPQGLKNVSIVTALAIGIPIVLVLLGRLSSCIRTSPATGHYPVDEEEEKRMSETTEKNDSTAAALESASPPDRPMSNGLPTTDRSRGVELNRRQSSTSITSNGERRFVGVPSMGSVSSAASSGGRLSRIGSARIGRTQSMGSDCSAWSGVNDVAVEMKDEKFRMPGASMEDGVRLPPRIANVSSTTLV